MNSTRNRLKSEVRATHTVLEHIEEEGCRAYLEIGRDLRHIRVADRYMEPPISRLVSMGFISRIDDGIRGCSGRE